MPAETLSIAKKTHRDIMLVCFEIIMLVLRKTEMKTTPLEPSPRLSLGSPAAVSPTVTGRQAGPAIEGPVTGAGNPGLRKSRAVKSCG
jgi:hypothetical protein